MSNLTIDLSGKGGLAPRFWGDVDRTTATPELRILGADNQVADGIFNPFRRYGYMSPSNATFGAITPDSAFSQVMVASLYDAVNDDFYFMDRNEVQIYRGDTLDDTTLTKVRGLGSTGTPIGMDLEIYQINGVSKVFYVYKKAGNMQVGIAMLPSFTSPDDVWLTSTTSGSFTNTLINEAFIRVADNGFAYLFQDNNVHKIDGTITGGANGTVTANALQFPAFFQTTNAIDYRGNMYIAIRQDTKGSSGVPNSSVYNSKVGIYIWDRFTTQIRTRDFIPLEGTKEIRNIYVSPGGELRIMVINSENITEIRRFTGSTFQTIVEVGINACTGFSDGLTTISNFTTWLGVNGILYAHGKSTYLDKEGIYKIGKLSDTITTFGNNAGAILFGGSSADPTPTGEKKHKTGLYLSYVTGGVSTMKEWDIHGTGADGISASQEQGDVFTLVKYLPQMSTVNYIDIYTANRNDTGSDVTEATLKIYFNGSTAVWASKSIQRNDIRKGYVRFDIDKPYINSIQLEIEFSPSLQITPNSFAPSFAVLDFTPTETKG